MRSPLAGTVVLTHVQAGSSVATGDTLITLESMKVHFHVVAEQHAQVTQLKVANGDTVEREQLLIELRATDTHHDTQTPNDDHSPPARTPHSSLSDWQTRVAPTLDAARQDAVAKRHAKGYLSARENLANLCDINEFNEYGQLAVAAQRGRKDYAELQSSTAADGVITGVAPVNFEQLGERDKVALIINDYSVLAGTQGFFHHQKLDRMLAVAAQQRLPVIMYTEGGGGRPGDTDITTVISGLQCTSFAAWAGLSGVVPRIAVANGYNFAGNAALFGAADIRIATQKSWIGMAGPAMIEGGGLGSFKPTEIGAIEVQSSNGVVDMIGDDETHAAQLAKQALLMFQGDVKEWHVAEQADLQSAMPEDRRETYAIRDIIHRLADTDSLLELKPDYGKAMVTAFIRLEGKAVGLLANDCMTLGGAVDVTAAEKAVEFMQLCDRFDIPLLSLCDTPGFMVGPAHETLGAVHRLTQLFTIGAQCRVPMVAVVLRKCYGLGAQAMLGGSTKAPVCTLAWPTGEFGAMGLEGAVALGFKQELDACATAAERDALFESLLHRAYQQGKANEVASMLEIDAVIDPAQTRQRVIQCLF